MRSETDVPISAYFSTAAICSTLNRFRFTASSSPIPGARMPETLHHYGLKIGQPITLLIPASRQVSMRFLDEPS